MQEAISNYLTKHGFERFEPKAVLFDMDGVLYDSMPNHARAWQQAMAQFDITMTAADAYATEGARGIDTIRMMVKAQQQRDISLEEAQRMYDVKTRLFHEMPEARIFYGVKSLMRKIRRSGMTIGVVTGSGQRPLINRLIDDFGEFLDAKGYPETLAGEMLSHLADSAPFSAAEMATFPRLFLDYCITGGMPEVVRTHIESGTFEGILNLQRQLNSAYRDDVRKYAKGIEQTRIINVLEHIPPQLAKENRKFIISRIERGARFKDYWGCVEWLRDAGIVNVCHCLNFPELPLKGNYDSSRYKLYLADSGLLVAQLDDEAQNDLRANRNIHTYKGGLFENIVAEAIKKSGGELYYYRREDSKLEEDFFLRTRSNIVPIEVKATDGRSKSLRTLIDSDHYPDIAFGVKIAEKNIGVENGIRTIPHFCAYLVKDWLSQM